MAATVCDSVIYQMEFGVGAGRRSRNLHDNVLSVGVRDVILENLAETVNNASSARAECGFQHAALRRLRGGLPTPRGVFATCARRGAGEEGADMHDERAEEKLAQSASANEGSAFSGRPAETSRFWPPVSSKTGDRRRPLGRRGPSVTSSALRNIRSRNLPRLYGHWTVIIAGQVRFYRRELWEGGDRRELFRRPRGGSGKPRIRPDLPTFARRVEAGEFADWPYTPYSSWW